MMPSQRPQPLNRSAPRIGIIAENLVVDECRKGPSAVAVHAVVPVGSDDSHEDEQKSYHHAEIRAHVWWGLVRVVLFVVLLEFLGWLGGDILDGLSLAEVGHFEVVCW